MPTEEDVKRSSPEDDAPEEEQAAEESLARTSSEPPEAAVEPKATEEEVGDVAPVGGVASPSQLGAKRFVFAAYFAGAIFLAFLVSKIADFAWFKLQNWKPAIGEPRDEIIMPLSALLGAGAAFYYWHRTRARQLAEEVAAEMSKVTWPTRTEVTNGTIVTIVATLLSMVFFDLMDKFWAFVTNLVYGGI
jgi:preprotein translocase subunit SecE